MMMMMVMMMMTRKVLVFVDKVVIGVVVDVAPRLGHVALVEPLDDF